MSAFQFSKVKSTSSIIDFKEKDKGIFKVPSKANILSPTKKIIKSSVKKIVSSPLDKENLANLPPRASLSPTRKRDFNARSIKKTISGTLTGSVQAIRRRASLKPDVRSIFPPSKKELAANRKVFGVSLQDLMKNQEQSCSTLKIPVFIHQTLNLLLENGAINEKGLFRISANHGVVTQTKLLVDSGIPLTYSPTGCDLHVLASLIKCFFRDLPSSLFPYDISIQLLKLQKNASDQQSDMNVEDLKRLLNGLPSHNWHLANAIFRFFSQIAANSKVNCMTASNLAITSAPNLIDHTITSYEDTIVASQACTFIIDNYQLLFSAGASPDATTQTN
jgi:hypothetical protein